MNRTDEDLRAVYIDPPGIADVERRLPDWIRHLEPTTTLRRRRTRCVPGLQSVPVRPR